MAKIPHALKADQKRSKQSFLDTYDESVAIPKALREALALMKKTHGIEHWLYETEFCTLAKVGGNKIGPYREKFAAYIVSVPGRDGRARNVWFADSSVADNMRKALGKNKP